MALPRFEKGTKYRVVFYRHEETRSKPYAFLGTYLGENQYTGEFQFDLRPEAGTQAIEPISVIEAYEMPHTSAHQLPQPA